VRLKPYSGEIWKDAYLRRLMHPQNTHLETL
jgi:hypothetical protein